MLRFSIVVILMTIFCSCSEENQKAAVETQQPKIESQTLNNTSLVILGTVQDAGSPQIGCPKPCCTDLDELEVSKRKVSALGIIDTDQNKKYLIDLFIVETYQSHFRCQYTANYHLFIYMFIEH